MTRLSCIIRVGNTYIAIEDIQITLTAWSSMAIDTVRLCNISVAKWVRYHANQWEIMQISERSCRSVRDHADQWEIIQITRDHADHLEIIKVTCWFAITLSRLLGHILTTRIDLWTDPISPRGRCCPAGLHTADTRWHACIEFLTYSVYHPSRQSGLCPSGERSGSTTRGNLRIHRSFPSVLKWLRS